VKIGSTLHHAIPLIGWQLRSDWNWVLIDAGQEEIHEMLNLPPAK
jgi:hypothetical protein